MKTIYSLQEFRQAVLDIARSMNEAYTSIAIEANHEGKVLFKAYTPQSSWCEGETMELCLQKMREKINPPPAKNIDVEIDLPEFINEEKG